MSWTGTYTHNVLLGIDFLGAIIFFNRTDLTISALCRIVQLYDAKAAGAAWAYQQLKLWKWQAEALRWLAPFLDDLQVNHCQKALEGDAQRARSALSLYNAVTSAPSQVSQ